jgi:anti-anti-sigma factor
VDPDPAATHARVEVVNGERRVVLSGEIDMTAVPEVFACIQEADRASTGPLVIMMNEVTLIDSSGLGVLARLAAAGVRMELRGPEGIVRRALSISGLDAAPNITLVEPAG